MSRSGDDLDLEWSSSGDSDFLREAHRKASKATKDKRPVESESKSTKRDKK